jgi:hypothetical protein
MECTVTRLLKDGERVCGAFGYRRATGEFIAFATSALVLATGGAGKCWRTTSNSWECMGDGHALAYDAGAELIDMEFVQFHPTGMVWPPGVIYITQCSIPRWGSLVRPRCSLSVSNSSSVTLSDLNGQSDGVIAAVWFTMKKAAVVRKDSIARRGCRVESNRRKEQNYGDCNDGNRSPFASIHVRECNRKVRHAEDG